MRKINKLFFILLLTLFACFNNKSQGQLPQCTGAGSRFIYFLATDTMGGGGIGATPLSHIYNLDPNAPLSPTNPSLNTIPGDSMEALAVSNNFSGPGPSPTFYAVKHKDIYYWNGTQWQGTGHNINSAYANNIAAGGGYIYCFDAQNGTVYRYDGTGNAIYIATVGGFTGGGPFDLVADCDGNFYVLHTSSPQYIRMYDKKGVLQKSWTISGAPWGPGGGGIAIVDNKVYFDFYGQYYVGNISSATNINFTPLYQVQVPNVRDFATCPVIQINTNKLRPSANPAYYCGSGPGTTLSAVGGTGIISWSVLSGPATISSTTGSSTTVTATDSAKILFTYYDTTLCGIRGTDTVHVVVPKANVDAGLPITILGCGKYIDSLNATLTNMTFGVGYSVAWSPAATVTIPGPNKLKPIITPTGNTTYVITVSTASSQGGCTWKDSVQVTVQDLREGTTDFDFEIDYGCTEDKVIFTNKTTTTNAAFKWNFGDSTAIDTTRSPAHIYKKQNTYDVMLVANDGICVDTVTKEVDINHPLKAAFTVDNDIFCTNNPVVFNSNITVASQTPSPPTYHWDFGDNKSSADPSPKHIYSAPGKYKATLTVTDFVPCTDTTSIELDNFTEPPYIDIGSGKIGVCYEETLYLPQGISVRGTDYLWSTGETTPKIAVTEPGVYYVELHNECGVSTDTTTVTFNDCTMWMADAFSPNGDGLNDYLRFRTSYPEKITNFSFAIYNRKGNRVFYTEDINKGWDGTYYNTPQPTGTYYYMIQFKFIDEDRMQKGDITLVR
ncbi:MAG: gliding motility-associated C-terminal domain-containing protein [Chitinophagaceae bacterium]|nr:gliding motility-associated C-terminal domain-containing protein [Chitinophagaceae bacterium]MCB9045251.1 gliding motility-associated C-terminal domain-containing protein [Chitinophagales bacterium]